MDQERNFTKIPNEFLEATALASVYDLTARERKVLSFMARRIWGWTLRVKPRKNYVGPMTVAKGTHLDRNNVKKVLKSLCKKGWLKQTPNGNYSKHYILCVPEQFRRGVSGHLPGGLSATSLAGVDDDPSYAENRAMHNRVTADPPGEAEADAPKEKIKETVKKKKTLASPNGSASSLSSPPHQPDDHLVGEPYQPSDNEAMSLTTELTKLGMKISLTTVTDVLKTYTNREILNAVYTCFLRGEDLPKSVRALIKVIKRQIEWDREKEEKAKKDGSEANL